jgi:hypothetical protein
LFIVMALEPPLVPAAYLTLGPTRRPDGTCDGGMAMKTAFICAYPRQKLLAFLSAKPLQAIAQVGCVSQQWAAPINL